MTGEPDERPVLIARVPPDRAAVEIQVDYGVLIAHLRQHAIDNGGSNIFDEHGEIRPEHRARDDDD